MCGIAGHVGPKLERGLWQRMSRAIAHRGPEDEGFFEFQAAGLDGLFVHRRLRIIDLTPGGHQPMLSAAGRLAVIFNGEIYNFLELRRLLEPQGFEFRTNSDTEVILNAYALWGPDCVEHLYGMFAFALWDNARQELLLARDRLGKKPLFYSCDGKRFAFGSEIKAILPVLDRTPPLDYEALDDYLTYLYVPYPKTIFQGIRQLPPATRMRVKFADRGIRTETVTYWSPLPSRQPGNVPLGEVQPDLQNRIGEAVRSRLVSDVPLGVLLSGGIDSSTVTALMARSLSEPVRSFSVGFRDQQYYDESPFAKLVADRFGCEHERLEAEPTFSHHLARIIWHFDQPFGNPTSVLTYMLALLTKRSVTVALVGDGGDELFGGYPRYVGAYLSRALRLFPAALRTSLLPRLGVQISDESNGRHQLRRLREFLEGAGSPLIEMYLDWIGYFARGAEKKLLYTPELSRRVAGYDARDFLRELYQQAESLEPLNRLAYVDIKSFLPCNVLEYADRMSMAHALELRSPFTDHRLVEFSLGIPFSWKFRFGETKWLLKQVMRAFLPPEVLNKQKLGFNPPVSAWLQTELRGLPEVLLSEERLAARGLFRSETVRRLLDLHSLKRRDFSLQIWALIVLEIWFQIYIDGHSVESVQEEIDHAVSGRRGRTLAGSGAVI